MPTIQQLAAKMNRDVTEGLVRNAQAMPVDKITWEPLDKGRTVHSQIAECAVITGFIAEILAERQVPVLNHETFGQAVGELDTTEKALAALKSNTETMANVIEAFPAEELDHTIQMPWFPEPSSFAEVMFISYWNNVYHIGQISYIQTLYGDNQMH